MKPRGRPTAYRGKNRDKPVQVAITDAGLRALDSGCRRTRLSRADYIERLLHRDAQQWAVIVRHVRAILQRARTATKGTR